MIKLLIYIVASIQLSLLCSQPITSSAFRSKKTIKKEYNGDIIYPNYIPQKFF